MNRTLLLSLVASLIGGVAHADKTKKETPDKKASAGEPSPAAPDPDPGHPAAGQCSYIQPGVKVCATIQGQGSFDVLTYPPAIVYVQFDDTVTHVTPPPKSYFRTEYKDNTVTIAPVAQTFPDPTPAVISAGSLTVTLNLRPGSLKQADTQVTIKDPDRGNRDAYVEKLVEERLGPEKKALAEKEQKLEEMSGQRASNILLDEMATGDVDVRGPGGKGITRNADLIVLRAKKVVRVGTRRYVVVTVENRSDQKFEVKGVKAWLDEGDAPRDLKVDWKFASTVIQPGDEVRGAIFLPLKSAPSGKSRLKVRVLENDSSRDVELGGIEVR